MTYNFCMLRRSSAALGLLAVLALAACSNDTPSPVPPSPVDDGATIAPSPDPSTTATPTVTPSTPSPTDAITSPPPNPAIAEVVGKHLQAQNLKFGGWCAEVQEGAWDLWCADWPEPQEGILVVRVGPVYSEYVYDVHVGFGDNGQYVIAGQGPVTERIR